MYYSHPRAQRVCAADLDDFGPEPDPSLYRADDGPTLAEIEAQRLGRRHTVAPSWERWG